MQAHLRTSLVVALGLVLTSGLAAAELPYHKIVSIKPQKKGAQVVGAKLLVSIHPTAALFLTAKVGLVKPADIGLVTRETAGSGRGLVLQAPAMTNLKWREPVEQEIVIPYGPDIKSGDKLRVLTAWPLADTHHVFGAVTRTDDPTLEVTMP
jgi:hypothetical protein